MMMAGQVWLTASQKLETQTELNAMIDRYVFENLIPLSKRIWKGQGRKVKAAVPVREAATEIARELRDL